MLGEELGGDWGGKFKDLSSLFAEPPLKEEPSGGPR